MIEVYKCKRHLLFFFRMSKTAEKPVSVPFRQPKEVEVPEVPVAAVQQLVGHHRQQEGEEGEE